MKTVVISGSILGRSFTFKLKIIEEMPRTSRVRVRIIDAFGVGYVLNKEYEVEPDEAKRLIDAKKAVPVQGGLIETAERKTPEKETAKVK